MRKSIHLDFVIPGFSKCGTTSLADAIGSHPDVFMCPGKEPGFFAENYQLGWDWYGESFSDYAGEKLVAEASTTYSSEEFAVVACQRILQHFPDCKFIFIGRDPVARIESSFREMHASGDKYGILPPFELGQAFQALPNMIADSKYWRLLQHYLERVPPGNIHVMLLRELRENFLTEINRCFAFLGLRELTANEIQMPHLNPAEIKMHDTRFYRWFRTQEITGRWWRRVRTHRKEKLIKALRFRRPFNGTIAWSDVAVDVFTREIASDAQQFLSYCGKPTDYWDLDVRRRRSNRDLARAA